MDEVQPRQCVAGGVGHGQRRAGDEQAVERAGGVGGAGHGEPAQIEHRPAAIGGADLDRAIGNHIDVQGFAVAAAVGDLDHAVAGNRGYEVHLSGAIPTDLVDEALFGTEDDASQAQNWRYYRTQNNLTWALNIPDVWDYPFEGVYVRDAYNHFFGWVQSGGTGNQNWFNDTRDESMIYVPYGISKRR